MDVSGAAGAELVALAFSSIRSRCPTPSQWSSA